MARSRASRPLDVFLNGKRVGQLRRERVAPSTSGMQTSGWGVSNSRLRMKHAALQLGIR